MTSAVRLHDVDDLYAHLNHCLNEYLHRNGAFLNPGAREDAIQDLVEEALKAGRTYDPARGWSFSKLCFVYIVERGWWMTNHYRRQLGDSRYGQNVIPESLRDEDRPHLEAHVVGPEVLEMVNTALLSPEARRTFEWFAWPHFVEQKPLGEVAEFRGKSRKEVKMRLESMAAELQAKCFQEAA